MFPGPLYDPMQDEFESDPKTFKEWHDFYRREREMPFRERLLDFCHSMIYFAASDLAYIDHGILEKPEAEIIFSLEYVAERLQKDSELLASLWILRERGLLGTREARWIAQHRLLVLFGRMGKERAHG